MINDVVYHNFLPTVSPKFLEAYSNIKFKLYKFTLYTNKQIICDLL